MTLTRPLLVLLAGLAATPALAQTATGPDEAVSTAGRRVEAQAVTPPAAVIATPPAAAPSTPMTTAEQIAAFLDASPAIERGEGLAGLAETSQDETPRKIHGSAGVTVGTGGYRSAYVATQIPIGQNATLGLAYAQTDHGNTAVFYPDHGDGVDLGRPGYREGWGHWGRGGKQQSVAISLAVGRDRDGPPEGCAPAFRGADGHYVEPLWATRIRGAQVGGRDNPCASGPGGLSSRGVSPVR